MVLFTRKRKLGPTKAPTLLNTTLSFASDVKYLGVTLDAKLTWNLHFERRLKKAYISYVQCRGTVGKTWGMKPNVVMRIYTAIVRPMLAYGAVVWWPKSQQTTAKQKLSQVQRVACLSITGAMRTTPTIAMEVMLCLPPLDIYLREMALTTMLRLENVGLKPVVGRGEVRSRLWNEVVRKTPLLQADTDSISPRFAFDKPYTVLIKRQEETARGDWAMDRHATVVQTELAGITIAAKEIARRHTTGKTIRIYTDSRQALLTLRNHKIMTRTVWECHEALVVASAANSISVCWISVMYLSEVNVLGMIPNWVLILMNTPAHTVTESPWQRQTYGVVVENVVPIILCGQLRLLMAVQLWYGQTYPLIPDLSWIMLVFTPQNVREIFFTTQRGDHPPMSPDLNPIENV
ncbi:uncharacterized protein LOC111691633 [Anoplophora glabripennis]|uniref:uncharacterized protein LOC111691633 n=1 Tax=Anoplophora glabripennis TaxID=217634 RepID=UPI000C780245|nr:uncharacterized protein LOC111691633 [Anoplophora glabripennis]